MGAAAITAIVRLSMGISDEIEEPTIAIDEKKISEIEAIDEATI